MSPAMLNLETRFTDGEAFFGLTGEISLRTSGILSDALRDAWATGRIQAIEVDMRHVVFIDSSGIQVLLSARRALSSPEQFRVVVKPLSQPDSVFRLGRFDTVMKIVQASS